MVEEQPMSNRITVDAAEQDHLIDSVTVFQAGRAEIKRRIELELKKGQNHVDIEHLPSCLHEDSVRVQGSGTAVIFDVVYHSPSANRQPADIDTEDLNNEASQCHRSLHALRKERTVVEKQIGFLDSYGHTLDSQSFGLDDVERFLDMYDSRRNALDKRIQELDLQIKQGEQAYREAKDMKHVNKQKEQRRTRITITVLAEADGKAELLLTYVVSNATWTPAYDIRASISQSPKVPSSIALHYRASITQTTGENWPEVALILSTASPHLGTVMPTLSSWRIGIPARPVRVVHVGSYSRRSRSWSRSPTRIIQVEGSRSRRSRSRSRSPTRIIEVGGSRSRRSRSRSPTRIIQVGSGAMSESDSENTYSGGPQAQMPSMNVRQADAVDAGVLSATFSIPGRSDIPSDQSTHKVLIGLLDLQAEPEWVCIPRKEESVFLQCTVSNSSEFTLLPGEARVFMDDNFVSKSRIQHVPPSDSFQVPLGTDSALRVTYAPVRTYNRTTTQSGFAFPGRQRDPTQNIKAYSQHIIVRNSRATAVSAVRVLDHVPVSNDSTVKVNVISPQQLKDANGSTEDVHEKTKPQQQLWVDLQQGVQARWAPVDVGGEGIIEWMCAIGAGQEVKLELGWEVSAPVGTKWETV